MFVLKVILLCYVMNGVSTQYSNAEILSSVYNRDVAPTFNGHPVVVNVSMVVLSLQPDLNAQMSFNVDFFYQLYWTDYRLKAPFDKKVTLGPQWKDKLWMPDTYFRNSISGGLPQLFYQSFYFTITKGIDVFMAARIQMKLNCDMNFNKFPFDNQKCYINITTLSQSDEFVRLNWIGKWGQKGKDVGFRIGSHVLLPEYTILNQKNPEFNTCTKKFGKIGSFSCLYVIIHLKRNIGKYIIKRYVPSTLIVIMTFIGFWIPTAVTPARVSLIITALLALIAQQIQGELNISYIYALEVFTIICIVFVFATLIEYAIAICWDHKKSQQNQMDSNNGSSKRWVIFIRADDRNCSVDVVSRTVFPSAFLIAIIIYILCYYFT